MRRLQQTVRSITSNWLLLAINVGLSFFMSPFVVGKLGSTYYGIWAVAMQFTGYLFLLDFGVRESVIRYTAKYVARKQGRQLNQILNTALVIYVPITILCALLAGACAWAVPYWFDIDEAHTTEARLAVFFVGLTIAQNFVFNVFTGILQGLNRFDIANAAGLVFTFIRAGSVVVALTLGYKLVALAAINLTLAVMGGTVTTIAAIHLLRSAGVPFHLKIPRRRRLIALGRKVFGYGFYVLINNVAQKINFASDAIVIGLFLPIAAVTPYAIAGSLIDYLRSLMVSTAQVFSPLSSKLHTQRRPEDLERLLVRGAKLTVLMSLPIGITYAVLGDHFIGLWMGREYMESAGEVLLVLGLLQIISAPHYIISSVLYGMSKHGTMGMIRVGEAAAKLALSIFLVRRMGIIGVAIATAISHSVVVLGLLPTLVAHSVGVSIRRYFIGAYLRPLLACIPFLLGALWLRSYWPARNLFEFFVEVGGLCCIYLATTYALVLDDEERQTIRRFIGKKSAPVTG